MDVPCCEAYLYLSHNNRGKMPDFHANKLSGEVGKWLLFDKLITQRPNPWMKHRQPSLDVD